MKNRILNLLLISIVTLFTSCNDDDNTQPELNGEYIGVYERNGNTSNVELNFENGNFYGESNTHLFPAICNGNYSISNTIILFENECIWTAQFDWTLILNQNWDYTLQNNILILTKSNGDKYTLTKQ